MPPTSAPTIYANTSKPIRTARRSVSETSGASGGQRSIGTMAGDVGAIQLGHGGAAEQTQGTLQIRAQDFQSAGHAGLTGRRQAVGVSPAAKDGAGAQAKRLDDVCAATNSSVHQDFDSAIHRGHDFGQRPQRGLYAIELPPAVIGDH